MKAILGIPISIYEAVFAVGGKYSGKDAEISYICTDSRELAEGGLFFAIGEGEKYTKTALLQGACVSSENKDCILVNDVNAALLKLASYYKTKLKRLKKVIAVTGSVGKTSVKDYTAALLCSKYKTHKSFGNYNNEIGLPLSLLTAPADTEILILEMGMNHLGEIERLSLCAKPDICIITNIGSAHIGNLGSREKIAEAKREITLGMENGISIIPSDEPLLADIRPCIKIGENADVCFSILKESDEGLRFRINSKLGITEEIHFPWSGEHFAKNLSFALAAAIECGMNLDELNERFFDYSLFIPRQKIVKTDDLLLYDDSYNASAEAFIADFKILALHKGKKSAVIGDVLELGEKTEEIHKAIGALAVKFKLDRIYPFGKYAPLVAKGAAEAGFREENIFINTDSLMPENTAKLICMNSQSGEMILIKGSRATKTERIIECIKAVKENPSL